MPNHVGKKRLLKLADLLEEDAKNKKGVKFDLDIIAAPSKKIEDEYPDFENGAIPKVDCGTAACAVGLACISDAFKRSGLSYIINEYGILYPSLRDEQGDVDTGWYVVNEFFDLSKPESNFLFMTEAYPDNKKKGVVGERFVAKRIRNFVAGKVSPFQFQYD